MMCFEFFICTWTPYYPFQGFEWFQLLNFPLAQNWHQFSTIFLMLFVDFHVFAFSFVGSLSCSWCCSSLSSLYWTCVEWVVFGSSTRWSGSSMLYLFLLQLFIWCAFMVLVLHEFVFIQALYGVYAKDVRVRMACLSAVKCIPAVASRSLPQNVEVATSIWVALHDPEKVWCTIYFSIVYIVCIFAWRLSSHLMAEVLCTKYMANWYSLGTGP